MNELIYRIQLYFYEHQRRANLILAIGLIMTFIAAWQVTYAIVGLRNNSLPKGEETPMVEQPDGTKIADGTDPLRLPNSSTNSQRSDGTTTSTNAPNADTATPSTTKNGGSTTQKPSSTPSKTTPSSPPKPSIPTAPTSISLRLIVPQSGKVLTLSGLNYNLTNYVPNAFGGIFNRSPYSLSKVAYPASTASDSISKGVTQLNIAVRSTPGQKIVLAHSQGAQVASHWMRQYANDPTAPSASELTFILFGNPLRSTGGYIIGRSEIGGTIGQATPTNTKWPIIDVSRRYDGWADWPQDNSNQWAINNALAGRTTFHTKYDQVNLYDTSSTVWKSGNTTYVLTKENSIPLKDKNKNAYPTGVQSALRAYIERAYKRPSNDPKPVILPIETLDWKNQLRAWGIPF